MLYMLRRSQWKKYVQYQKKLCGSNIIFHIIYKITSIDGIPAATHYCSYLKKTTKKRWISSKHCKIQFLISNYKSSFVKNISKIKNKTTPLQSVYFTIHNKPRLMATCYTHNDMLLSRWRKNFCQEMKIHAVPPIALSHLLPPFLLM